MTIFTEKNIMANNNVKATVTVTMNGEAAKKVLNELDMQAQKLKKSLSEARISGDTKKIKEVERELRAVQNSIKTVTRETKSYQDILKNLNCSTIRELEVAARSLRNEIKNKLIPGTKEFVEKSKQLKNVEARIKGVTASTKTQTSSFGRLTEKFNKYFSIATAGIATVTGLSLAFRKAAQDAAKMSDAYANVRKYTGLTAEDVNELNISLKKMDTRTGREQLNELAADAGRLGIKGKKEVLEFVEAADVINVALGKDLGEDAVKNIGKLTYMFGETDKYGLRAAMLKVGSTINEVAQNSTAAESYLLTFTNRMSGIGNQANITIPQLIGFASVLDQNAQSVELSTTALDRFIVNMINNTGEVANAAGIAKDELQALINTDMNAAMLRVFEALNSKGGLVDLAPLFKDLGAEGGRAAKIIAVLAKKYEDIIKEQKLAQSAYEEGTSATKEFGVQNDTMQAKLEKARKKFADVSEELGKKLSPIVLKSTNLTTNLIKVMASADKTYSEHKVLIWSLVSAWGAYIVIMERKRLVDLLDVSISKVKYALGKAQLALVNLRKIAVLGYIVVKNRMTGATLKADAAQKLLNATMAKTPWGLILAGATAVATIIYKIATATTTAEKAMKEFNKEVSNEEAKVRILFETLKNNVKYTKEYEGAKNAIIEQYGDYLEGLVNEKGEIIDINTAYERATAGVRAYYAEKKLNEKIEEETTKYFEKQKDIVGKMRDVLKSKRAVLRGEDVLTDAEVDVVLKRVVQMNDEGQKLTAESWKEIGKSIGKNINPYVFQDNVGNDLFNNLSESSTKTKKIISELKQQFNPFITKGAITEADQLALKTNELNILNERAVKIQEKLNILKFKEKKENATTTEDQSNLKKDLETINQLIKAKNEEIGVIKAAQLAKQLANQNNGEKSGSGLGTLSEEELKNILKQRLQAVDNWLTQEQNKLKESRNANLITEEQYIDQVKQLTIQSIHKKLAIKGQEEKDYLQLNSQLLDALYDQESRKQEEKMRKLAEEQKEMLVKAQEDLNDLVTKNADVAEKSPLLKAIFGTAKDFDDKKAELLKKVEKLQKQIIGSSTDEEKAKLQESINALNTLINGLDTQKWTAVSNTIKKEVKGVTDFITDEQEKQAMEGLSKKEQQILIITKLYKKERDIIEEAIREQSKFATDEAAAQIEKLKALLVTLGAMEESAIAKVSDDWSDLNTGIDSVDRMMGALGSIKEMFETGFNLRNFASALQTFNDIAFQMVGQFHQIQKNKEDQELQDFKRNCEEKKIALQEQLNAGLISQDDYNTKLAQIDAEYEAKETKIKSDQFEREKQASIIQALISGALAIVQAFAQLGAYGAIAAAFIAGVTALQVATISSQPNPYKGGASPSSGGSGSPMGGRTVTDGYIEGGNTMKDPSDQKPAGIVHANEWVAPAWMVRENPVMFSNLEKVRKSKASIAAERESGSFASGGYATTSKESGTIDKDILKQFIEAIDTLKNTRLRAYLVRKDITEMDDQDSRFKQITSKK